MQQQQLSLSGQMIKGSIDAAFEVFHSEKPEVYTHFKHYAEQLLNRGYKRYSADGILHIVRFNIALQKSEKETYKINNNYSSRYARLLMQEDKRFENFFETRVLKS